MGLRDRLADYRRSAESLSSAERDRVVQALTDQNEIALLISCQRNCDKIDDLPVPIRDPILDLFGFAFGLLSDIGLRDRHYEIIYQAMLDHVCPFCGCEDFDAPKGINTPSVTREALDHYLTESKYPFAAANLRNLVPMGHKCNSGYKLATDMLWNENGVRRRSFDPYNASGLKISLQNSRPFAGGDPRLPSWQIDFDPDTEEAATWDIVFHIRERYGRDVLDGSYLRWLGLFGSFCRSPEVAAQTDQELVDALDRYAANWELGGWSERAFLKAAVFRMLHKHVKQGDQRLIRHLKDVIDAADRTNSPRS